MLRKILQGPAYKKYKFIFSSIGLLAALAVVFAIVFAQSATATTIGTNISTTGTLAVGNNADFTLGGTERILIDAATTDTSLTTGVIDMNLDVLANATGVVGQDVAVNLQGTTALAQPTVTAAAYHTTVAGPSTGLQANNWLFGNAIRLAGNSNDAANSVYGGLVVISQSILGSAEYDGAIVVFDSVYGGADIQSSGPVSGYTAVIRRTAGAGDTNGAYFAITNTSNNAEDIGGVTVDLTNSGTSANARMNGINATVTASGNTAAMATGSHITVTKSAGAGVVYGSYVKINNSSVSTTDVRGQAIEVDLGNTSPATSIGLAIYENGSGSGNLADGIYIATNNAGGIVDAIDVSATDITNAINVGMNTILASGSFSINLNQVSANTLTITNSEAGASYLASVAVEGGVTIGNNGENPGTAISKHLSGTATNLTSANIGAKACGDYGTITVAGAAVGNTVYASPDASSSASGIEDSNLSWSAVVSSTGTVTIRACNPTEAGIDAGNDQEWRADVWQH